MIAIHPVHRRLAEIHMQAKRLGGYQFLPLDVVIEFNHCIAANAELVVKLDQLKNLAFVAHCSGDFEWEQQIYQKIDELEARMI